MSSVLLYCFLPYAEHVLDHVLEHVLTITVAQVPGPMYKELNLPAIMNCGGLKDSLKEMNLWINSGGAKSIIHKVTTFDVLPSPLRMC